MRPWRRSSVTPSSSAAQGSEAGRGPLWWLGEPSDLCNLFNSAKGYAHLSAVPHRRFPRRDPAEIANLIHVARSQACGTRLGDRATTQITREARSADTMPRCRRRSPVGDVRSPPSVFRRPCHAQAEPRQLPRTLPAHACEHCRRHKSLTGLTASSPISRRTLLRQLTKPARAGLFRSTPDST